MIYEGMSNYLRKRPEGKMFHDPLACSVAIDPAIVETVEVEVFREKGMWGSKLSPGSNTWISVSVDKDKFLKTMLETGLNIDRKTEKLLRKSLELFQKRFLIELDSWRK